MLFSAGVEDDVVGGKGAGGTLLGSCAAAAPAKSEAAAIHARKILEAFMSSAVPLLSKAET